MELSLMELHRNGRHHAGDNTLTVGGLFLTYYKNAHLVHEGNKNPAQGPKNKPTTPTRS